MNALDDKDQPCILKLAKFFKVSVEEGQVFASFIKTLWKNIEIIPASPAMTHVAEESKRRTSRFIPLSNAMHGKLVKYILWSMEYIKTPRSIMDDNQLSMADEAYWSKDLSMYLTDP